MTGNGGVGVTFALTLGYFCNSYFDPPPSVHSELCFSHRISGSGLHIRKHWLEEQPEHKAEEFGACRGHCEIRLLCFLKTWSFFEIQIFGLVNVGGGIYAQGGIYGLLRLGFMPEKPLEHGLTLHTVRDRGRL